MELRAPLVAAGIVLLLSLCAAAEAQQARDGVLKLGGFRCIDLRPLKNDTYLDLYKIGYWSYASFRLDVWKRTGVPFWQPQGAGNIRVAGPDWRMPPLEAIPGTAHADAQQPGNGAIANANDGDLHSYWYAGDHRPHGDLWVEFDRPTPVRSARFLAWETPRHAPRDYTLGLILPGGERRPLADVHGEKRMGEWIEADAGGALAAGVYLDVASTMEHEHGPVVYELQARGAEREATNPFAAEVEVPLHRLAGEELFFLGNVGDGFDTTPDAETPLGQYVLHYADGKTETIPLVGGRNVAGTRYGRFVPEAQYAFGLREAGASMEGGSANGFYHLDEMLPVEPKRQVMLFSHRLGRPHVPLASLTFRCTNRNACLILQGLTLRVSGPRMNILVVNGKRIAPVPAGTPQAPPSALRRYRDRNRTLSLDGRWQYCADPGNQGVRHRWFDPAYDAAGWKTMPVPSQWYVKGLDYHGVVWFRRTVDVPAAFPGEVLELAFERVDYDARVWVNGQYVGRHVGAYSAFRLDATRALRKGARNTVVVRVDSPLDPGFTGAKTVLKGNAMDDIAMPYAEEGSMGGIYRHVSLVGRGDVAVEDAWAHSKVSDDLSRAAVTVSLDLRAGAGAAGPVTVSCRLQELPVEAWQAMPRPAGSASPWGQPTGKRLRTFAASREVSLASGAAAHVDVPFDIEHPRLWYPWEQGPAHLHLLVVEVRRGGTLLDRHVSRVGIKETSVDRATGTFYVNHHRLFVKGMLNDDVHWQSLMDRTAYRQRIQLQKDANLNLIRLTTHQSSPDFYELCDEMGVMVWQEMPLQWSYSTAEPIRQQILGVVRETVTQTRPHACVVGYSAWNEGGQSGFTEKVTDLIAALDPTRPMTRACGGGDFDVHIYPTMTGSLARRTFLWSGVTAGFISETGAYGTATIPELQELFGKELFPFDGADYLWEIFCTYRWVFEPVFLDAPQALDWPIERVGEYVRSHADASSRRLAQVMKSMFETMRGQRFAPTTSLIHCRFDDPFPTNMLGIVNFGGRPLAGYYGVRQACQQVLPLLRFDAQGAEDVRVVNDYWRAAWTGCRLHYVLKTRSGDVVRDVSRTFDLPPDSTVKVLSRDEAGDLWGRDGFAAELTVRDAQGRELSRNTYDFTAQECEDFVTSLYPAPPIAPYRAHVLRASEGEAGPGFERLPAGDGCYSPVVLAARGADAATARFRCTVGEAGEYLVRAACDSGAALHSFELWVDGARVPLETYPGLDTNQMITRDVYGPRRLAWFPGWRAKMAAGSHVLELRGPAGAHLTLDALAVQRTTM